MSTTDPNGVVEDTVLRKIEDTRRDIRNHMLFEVSTEAANRGTAILMMLALVPLNSHTR